MLPLTLPLLYRSCTPLATTQMLHHIIHSYGVSMDVVVVAVAVAVVVAEDVEDVVVVEDVEDVVVAEVK